MATDTGHIEATDEAVAEHAGMAFADDLFNLEGALLTAGFTVKSRHPITDDPGQVTIDVVLTSGCDREITISVPGVKADPAPAGDFRDGTVDPMPPF
jgi:hypothetical protein